MIEFNSNHIIAGQIKQILSSFNLPKYRIYTQENKDYFEKYKQEKNIVPTIKKEYNASGYPINMQYHPYIKDNIIQYYIAEKIEENTETYAYYWQPTTKIYNYNYNDVNWVTQLRINSNIYDTYTHEYLGNYLRFKRDYEQIDLMPLYNCFSNKICNNVNLDWELNEHKIKFNTDNENYKIYMLPVKLFKQYTIAIDCSSEVEICCGVYGKYQDTREKIKPVSRLTYKKYNQIMFSQPVIYTPLLEIADLISGDSLSDIANCEQDLKMFIKLPINNNSSIVVLEGDYRRYNDSILNFITLEKEDVKTNTLFTRTQNYTVTNFDTSVNDFEHFKPITPLQLLRANTKKSYPFADRLIEYLLDNVISHTDKILDDVRRTQEVIKLNNKYPDPNTLLWDKQKSKFIRGNGWLLDTLLPKTTGVWEASIRPIVYDKFNTAIKANNNDNNHDILGYIDKDIENWYRANSGEKDKNNNIIYTTISGIDLYTTEKGLYSDVEDND